MFLSQQINWCVVLTCKKWKINFYDKDRYADNFLAFGGEAWNIEMMFLTRTIWTGDYFRMVCGFMKQVFETETQE